MATMEITEITQDGVVYKFVDEEAQKSIEALSARVSRLNDAQTEAIRAEAERAQAAETAFSNNVVFKEVGKGLSSNDFTDEYKDMIGNPPIMIGATEQFDGVQGSAPKPLAGDNEKYLRGDGTWEYPPNTEYDPATHRSDGLMSKEDKAKLDNLDDDLDENLACNTVITANTITQTFGNGKTKKLTINADGSIMTEITRAGADKITLNTVFSENGITRTRS